MSHHLRVSATSAADVIEKALTVYHEMKDHVEACNDCNDETGICAKAEEIWLRVEEAQRSLRRIGFDQ